MNKRHQSYILIFMVLAMLLSQVSAQAGMINMLAMYQPLQQHSHIHHAQTDCHDQVNDKASQHHHRSLSDCAMQTDQLILEKNHSQQVNSKHDKCQDCTKWHCQLNTYYVDPLEHLLDFKFNIAPDTIFNSFYTSQYIQQPIVPLLRPPKNFS